MRGVQPGLKPRDLIRPARPKPARLASWVVKPGRKRQLPECTIANP